MTGPSNHKKANPLQHKYILHNVELESGSAAKYLGVTIEDDFSWTKHIDITTKKAIVGNPNRKKMHIFDFVGIFEYIC